ncbi:quinol:electron acceptor oxidoreductase subunit ActD [Rhizosaccharibacter radicis]|uniref:DUF3341 domain-containing protein n=1 Tax=Rhizosaccharibacter radicis TaxID=2782605 RepID=A0ABT1VT10_9PROT|nr:DUF3341 domain-containing protein [Acetobacteraceae bacterium KSS12]
MPDDLSARLPPFLLDPREDYASVERRIARVAFDHPGWRGWWIAMTVAVGLLGVLAVSVGWLLIEGVGVWGNNIPVTWALDIVSYDWWIGIATGAFALSAASLLLGSAARSALSRIAETIAVMATVSAGIYPIIHLGRPWFFFWNLPYPNTLLLWPQFRSPLVWDAFDIVSFLGVAVSFWFVGMLPDLATLRDAAITRAREALRRAPAEARHEAPAQHGMAYVTAARLVRRAHLYGIAALGWRGSAAHWQRWAQCYRTVALFGLFTVVSLQTGAAVMYAGTVEPGWHDTMLPAEFVAGALLQGVAAVTAGAVVLRWCFGLDGLITPRHLSLLGGLMLALGLLDLYCHAASSFAVAIGTNSFEHQADARRLHGPHGWAFWGVLALAFAPVQLFWFRRCRIAPVMLLGVSLCVLAGCWCDHFVTIVDTLQHDFLPSSAQLYAIGIWGAATFLGSTGLVLSGLLLAVRYLPVLSILGTRYHLAPVGRRSNAPGPKEDGGDAPLWGVSAEFDQAGDAIAAATALRRQRLGRVDLYSPVPLSDAPDALALGSRPVWLIGIAAALLGGIGTFTMCAYATGIDYVFLIGGRPRFSWPSFVVPSLSFATVSGAVAMLLAMLVLNRLPRLNHPAFNIPGFEAATDDRFFVSVEADGDRFDPRAVEAALRMLAGRPISVARVPR